MSTYGQEWFQSFVVESLKEGDLLWVVAETLDGEDLDNLRAQIASVLPTNVGVMVSNFAVSAQRVPADSAWVYLCARDLDPENVSEVQKGLDDLFPHLPTLVGNFPVEISTLQADLGDQVVVVSSPDLDSALETNLRTHVEACYPTNQCLVLSGLVEDITTLSVDELTKLRTDIDQILASR